MNPAFSRGRRWILAGKVVGTAAILTVLLLRIDVGRAVDATRHAAGFWLGIAFVTYASALIVSSYKWGRLLKAVGVRARYAELLKLYTIGFFASSFLPGVIGGDVVRWHLAGREAGGRVRVAATIVAERVTGVVALVILSVLAVLVAVPAFATAPVFILLGSISTVLVGGIVLVLDRRLAAGVMALAGRVRAGPVVRPVYHLLRVMRGLSARSVTEALVYSVGFYVSGGLAFWMIGKAFQVDVTLVQAVAVQALISLLTLIPISLGGLGLAQVGDVYLLGILGVPAADALAISITRQVIKYGYALIGGLLYLGWDERNKPRSAGPRLAESVPVAPMAPQVYTRDRVG